MSFLICGCGQKGAETVENAEEEQMVSVNIEKIDEEEELPPVIETVTVGACGQTNVDILASAVPVMRKMGYEMNVKIFSDYNACYDALVNGEIGAALCSHAWYLRSYNNSNATDIESLGAVYYIPYRIYSEKSNDISDLSKGGSVAIPDDVIGEARAMLMLKELGAVTIREDVKALPHAEDIVENTYGLTIEKVSMEKLSKVIGSYDYVIVDSNVAIYEGYDAIDGGIYTEQAYSESALSYAYILTAMGDTSLAEQEDKAVRASDEDGDADESDTTGGLVEKMAAGVLWHQTLSDVLMSTDVRQYMFDNYHGSVVVCRDIPPQIASYEDDEETTTEETVNDKNKN